jgi:hypothetical protein
MIYLLFFIFVCPECPSGLNKQYYSYLKWTKKKSIVYPVCPWSPYYCRFGRAISNLDIVGQPISNYLSKLVNSFTMIYPFMDTQDCGFRYKWSLLKKIKFNSKEF